MLINLFPSSHIFQKEFQNLPSVSRSFEHQTSTQSCSPFLSRVSVFGIILRMKPKWSLEFYQQTKQKETNIINASEKKFLLSSLFVLLHLRFTPKLRFTHWYMEIFISLLSSQRGREAPRSDPPSPSLPLTHASVGGQAAQEQQTTPSAPPAGSSCSAPERSWRRLGKTNSYKRTREDQELEGRTVFPKSGILILQHPGVQHAVTGWTSRGDYCAARVAAARFLRDRWERWAAWAGFQSAWFFLFVFLKGGGGVYWSTSMLSTAKLTYLIHEWKADFLFCGRKRGESLIFLSDLNDTL